MLYTDPILYFRGLTIFRDFSTPDTYYFLPPEAPRIARSAEGSGNYALRLVIYRPDPNAAPPQGMEDGGGFLNLDVDLHVPDALREEAEQEIRRRFGGQANLVPVPFMQGAVELVLLGVGRDDEGQPFVRKVAGSTVPSLYGSQRAAFSAVLDRDGAALMQQVIRTGGATMALAIYHLTYAGIGPAYNLKITIDYERVFEHLDLRLNAGISARRGNASLVGKAGFHLLIEELREKRIVRVEETDPVPGENGRTPVDQTKINEIIGNLMGSKWFKPTLAQSAQMTNLAGAAGTGSTSTSGTGSSSSGTGSSSASSGSSASGSSASGSSATASQRPNATWQEDAKTPTNFSADLGVEPFQPSTSGTEETLVVRGAGATAKVGPRPDALQPATLQGNRLVVDVAGGQTRHVEITWPAVEPGPQPQPQPQPAGRFHLFFAFEEPDPQDVAGYVAGNPPPPTHPDQRPRDARYLDVSQAEGSLDRGPDALRAWLSSLTTTRLKLRAYASFENDPNDRQLNLDLSQRRLDVATGLIQRFFPSRFDTSDAQSLGHDPASANAIPTLTPGGGATDSHNSKPEHRVVIIEAIGQAAPPDQPEQPQRPGRPQSVLRGHLSRGAGGRPDGDKKTTIEASFEINLEMIERRERIEAVYELNSRRASTHEVHPQGQLLLEAIDPSDYILEADGAIDFFQWLDIAASTTAQWELEGIDSIHLEIRYAPRDGGFRRTGEIVLTPNAETGRWRTGVLRETDDSSPVLFWYDYRVTVHYLPDVALGDQSGAVTSVGIPNADEDGWLRSTERNLVIHPRDVTPAITVNLAAGLMRFDLLQRAQLSLFYGPYRQNLTLAATTSTHRLVIRPEPGLEDAVLRTEGTLFYTDGAQVPLPPREWTPQELIVVNEPRENVLRVQVVLADPAGAYTRVHVRLRYEHGDRIVEEERELTAHAQIEQWAVRLEEPAARAWKYQATLIKRSGDIDTTDWIDGEEGQLILGVQAVDVIPVQVTWLLPPPAGGLLAVQVDLRYEDERNRVQWNHSELIRGEHTGDFTWSIPIQDPGLRTYRYRVTEFRATGVQEGAWQETTKEKLVLLPSA